MIRAGGVFAGIGALALLGGCEVQQVDSDRPETARDFPQATRPVSDLGANSFSTEQARDNRGEAVTVMDLAGIEPGMTVADIGAGEGYYTVRLAERVGQRGRVLAQDIDPDALSRLGRRVEGDRLENVSIALGGPDDPHLPADSFDRVFMVHMYHEVEEPYAFLWRLYPALREGGKVIVVDTDRPSNEHGLPPKVLFCEFERLGFRLREFVRKPEMAGYYASFEIAGPRPEPAEIEPCALPQEDRAHIGGDA
ncbi:class I SAM-dependent methyltransferase [Paraurantiacibacter namhicola]|uniref:Ubiquinone/menaquinone biosynthesis C-methyltransferase UbiE n=1 Tax=Paraurantiacibacter namhicola TaxID=645517 RepID=A0A1C7D9F3_9SPHN|nr:methyltransferase domain-containing protein [Paraurantiacibacter namhicola]ANU08116.1 Ubiquinone/menaquinone biosynthesis C-methyltransferase UbiE [Paraurantiacibacter namhicola]